MSRRGVAAVVDKNTQRQINALDTVYESEVKPLVDSTVAKYGSATAVHSCEQEYKGSSLTAEIKTYKWRWVVLCLFFMNNLIMNYVWIMAAPVANLICCYYRVSLSMVNLLSTVFMITYVLLVVVVSWAIERYGLKVCVVVGSAAGALGTSIAVAGSGSSYFWVLLLGQIISSFSNIVFFGTSPLLSEIWFPSSERVTATALGGAIAPQFGIMLSLFVGPILSHNTLTDSVCNDSISSSVEQQEEWREFTYYHLFYYHLAVAIVCILIFIATLLGFHDAPPIPPSQSRQIEASCHQDNSDRPSSYKHFIQFVVSALLSLKNVYFILFLLASGIIIGAMGALMSIINEIVLPYFPGRDEEVAYLGLATQGTAVVSMLLIGRVLDWTKSFYALSVLLSTAGALSLAAFMALILFQHHFYLLYVAVMAIGATLVSFQAVGYEYAVEMTYPLPETISIGLINLLSQIVGLVMIQMTTPRLIKVVMWSIVGTTTCAALLTVFTRPKLRREEIDRDKAGPNLVSNREEGEGKKEQDV